MKELTIQYAGGSGGFLLLHLVLLSGKYQCKFRSDQVFDKFFKDQWNITDHARWKMGEVWPDNRATLESSIDNKVYLICNPDRKCCQKACRLLGNENHALFCTLANPRNFVPMTTPQEDLG